MKKNVIDFTTKEGNTYKLTRPTAEKRADIYEALEQDKDGNIKNGFRFAIKCARAVLDKSVDIDDLTDLEIGEISNRAFELASLGK